ncbi:MAG TPA: SDR family oxidoreductase [Candidatus Acidoferrales bacterium]|nr:SDR family oxidoreductase [Candidatus Acidoferrales bacterium]
MKLNGKVALITGASLGLGRAVASAFAREGSDVLMCARNAADLEAARSAVAQEAPQRRVVARKADMTVEDDVAQLFETAASTFGRLDVLVCNAGIFGPKGRIEDLHWRDWAHAIATNLLGPVLCVQHAMPLLRKAAHRPKIVITSGGGAERAYPLISSYATSKTGLVRFGESLALQLGDDADVNMLAPGQLNTRMVDDILDAGPAKVGQSQYDGALRTRATGGASIENAAELAVFLASSESDGISGRLIHAVRDPWRTLAEHREELAASDLFQLRRVDLKDRGLDWK